MTPAPQPSEVYRVVEEADGPLTDYIVVGPARAMGCRSSDYATARRLCVNLNAAHAHAVAGCEGEIEKLKEALTGCIGLVEKWMAGPLFKGVEWISPPPALAAARLALGASTP
jgi:hypothetical protein